MPKSRSVAALFLIILLLLPSCLSGAESASHIECDCTEEHCTCFIQLGDEGNAVKEIIKLLIGKKYLDPKTPTGEFTQTVETAVRQFQSDHTLEPTGTMDDDTLTLLIWEMTPEELDLAMPLIPGKPETYPDLVWLPTDGGKKRHSHPECCGMLDPRKVSIRNAEKLGFDPCGKNGCEKHRETTLHII